MTDQPAPAPPTPPRDDARPARGPRVGAVVGLVVLAIVVAAGVVGVGISRGLPTSVPSPTGDAVVDAPHHGGPVEAGDGYAVWERNEDGAPIRWDPCSDVEVVVNPEGAPSGAAADLERALAEVAAHTGLSLRVVDDTDERPAADRAAYQPERYGQRWAPVLVAWAEPHENGVSLRDIDRGLAVPVAVGEPGQRVYVTGQVVLNAHRDDLRPGFEDRADSWGATLLHELAHLVGLAHVDDPTELMAIHPGAGPVAFGPGDRAGLAAVGAAHGCLDVPQPRPVEVAPPPER
ncbi:hypothetical protein [Egicoccus sp. AB-alg2]|uniref:hypothetical protein n=1 Tax=Egicoccus sp. AB-alg2 TaxID=3242693 RepID=UPI00359E70BD